MRNTGGRIVAAVLALSAADVGIWATAAPRSFVRSFPGAGHRWVASLGPYNEHLVRDVGGLYLALLVISAWAAWRPTTENLRVVGAAWLAFSIPHVIFHARHLHGFGLADQVGTMVALGGTLVLGLVLVRTRASKGVA